jgi:hypothetical protein
MVEKSADNRSMLVQFQPRVPNLYRNIIQNNLDYIQGLYYNKIMRKEIIDALIEGLTPTIANHAITIFDNLEQKVGKNRSLLKVALPLARRLLQNGSSVLLIPELEDKILSFTNESWPLFESANGIDEEAKLMVILRDEFIARYAVDEEIKTTVH